MTLRRFLSELAGLAALSIGLALLLTPALALAASSIDPDSWSTAFRQSFPIMAFGFFATLGAADLLTRGLP